MLERTGVVETLAWAPSGMNMLIGGNDKRLIAIDGVERMAPPSSQISLYDQMFKPNPISLGFRDSAVGHSLLERAIEKQRTRAVSEILTAPLGLMSIDRYPVKSIARSQFAHSLTHTFAS